jgi:hypothetical protein
MSTFVMTVYRKDDILSFFKEMEEFYLNYKFGADFRTSKIVNYNEVYKWFQNQRKSGNMENPMMFRLMEASVVGFMKEVSAA